MTRRIWVVAAAVWFTMFGWAAAHTFDSGPTPGKQRSVYDIRANRINMPDRVVLTKSCLPAEDTMGKLILVNWDPARGLAVYRCRRPSAY